MIYCGECKKHYALSSEVEQAVPKKEIGLFGCEFCASTKKEAYFSAWHRVGDIITRAIDQVEISASVKLQLDKIKLKERKLDQEDRRLNLEEAKAFKSK